MSAIFENFNVQDAKKEINEHREANKKLIKETAVGSAIGLGVGITVSVTASYIVKHLNKAD